MKNPIPAVTAAVTAVLLPASALADLAFNVSAVSDYRYRGISQTRLKPAVQGGLDFSAGGLYLGAWASTIKWIEDARGDAKLEFDLYGGILLAPHVGYQKVAKTANASYTDYALAVSKDFSGLVASAPRSWAPMRTRVSTCPVWPPTVPNSWARPASCWA